MDRAATLEPRRRVLMIARFLPPLGGAGVHRSLGSVRHLPEHGYDVRVITGAGVALDRWSPEDPGLAAGLPPGTEIHRLDGPEPADPPWTRRAERLIGRQTPWIRWWLAGVVRRGLEVGADADLIYVSCAPYETAWAGARLAELLGKPWVADLEDPWALDEMRVHPTALQRRLDLSRMRRALSTASAVVVCAPEAAIRMRRALPGHAPDRIAGIEIGFDGEAFAAPAVPRPAGGAFRIVHTGSMHTDLGQRHRRSRGWRRALGGLPMDVDILTRSHVFLLEAIDRLLADDPALRGRIELHLAGDLTAADRAANEGHAHVHTHGSLSHQDTAALMGSADLLFLPMQDLTPGRRAGLIPYKTFEYLAAERPILAAVPDGDVRDLLAPLAHASLVRPADVTGMAAAIRTWIDRGPVATVDQGVGSPELAGLERRRQVTRIARVLDDVLGVRADAAGAAH
ncbi:MAG: glycosyltransferase family 4 protein [Conexibacter sp.]|nr:glycosyltransferase family 4 protein [Conexibacter sp.]